MTFVSCARGGCLARGTPIESQIVAGNNIVGSLADLVLLFACGISSAILAIPSGGLFI
jgi:hypothetical protein